MAIPAPSTENSLPEKHRLLRWAVVLVATLMLHLFIFSWMNDRIGVPSFRDPAEAAITTELLRAAPPDSPRPAPAPPPPKPRVKPRTAPPGKAPPPVPAAQAEPEALLPVGMEVPGTSTEPVIDTVAAAELQDSAKAPPGVEPQVAAAPDVAEKEKKTAPYKFDPPPSVNLNYDVYARRDGQKFHGGGRIIWHSQGQFYLITGEASLLVFTLLNFKSDGVIDEFGVSPVLYSEKRLRKPETNTHFHRERNTISFSASTATYPRNGGEQDRASIIWQLAAIGRGDAARFADGTDIDIFVAGVRDGETWRIHVVGEEEVDAGIGKVRAWHVVRHPRPGSYDQKIDIWLAPQKNWYPVRLLYTESNGDFLDMSLSNLHLLSSP
jgi:hypothetical protein